MNSLMLMLLVVCAILLLVGGLLMLLAAGALFFWSRSEAQLDARLDAQRPSAMSVPPPYQHSAVSAPPPVPPAPTPGDDLVGLAEAEEGAKTEVFQRSHAMEWDADDEGEATEVFRPEVHGDNDLGYKLDS